MRIALVGCGGIATVHVRAYRSLEGVVWPVAVCDVETQLAAQRAQELGGVEVYHDLGRLLKGVPDLEAVDICLPHHLHAPAALAALRAGKHVLVEKPLANTLEDADAMVAAARQAGVCLQVGHNERFDPQYQEMKRLVDAGVIGEVFCARADHNQDFRRPGEHWLKRNATAGGGVLIGSGIHRVDLLRWLLGEVVEVYSMHAYRPDRLEGEAVALTTLRFASGSVAEVSSNWAVRRAPWYELMWLYGSRGSMHNVGGLHVDGGEDGEGRPDGGWRRVSLPDRDSFTEEMRHFAESVRSGRQPLTSGWEGRQALAVVLAAYRSVAEGRPITLA